MPLIRVISVQSSIEMRLLWLLATLLALASAGVLQDPPKDRFDHFQVYKLAIKNKVQLAVIQK